MLFRKIIIALIGFGVPQFALAGELESWKITQNALTSVQLRENSGEFTVVVGATDKVVMQYDVIPHAGVLFVCGNVWISGHSYRTVSKQMLKRDLAVYLDETQLVKDVSYFNRVSSKKMLLRSKANCQDTGVPVPSGANHTMEIKLLKSTFRE